MSDELLKYYNRELTSIRRLSAEFAEANPRIAERLRISGDTVEDPHVARLIEGFAFLTAQIRHKLDDDFPELTDALLGALYPHYQAPIPSMAIAHMECEPDLTGRYTVPRGSQIETDAVDGEPCRFRTCFPVDLWPIRIASAGLFGRPFTAPSVPGASRAVAVLRLVLRCASEQMTFAELSPDRFRFFLRLPPPHCYVLYELLFNNVIEVALANAADDDRPIRLGAGVVKGVGFESADGLLPYPARSALGYRLLTEFFVFPSKFLFFEIDGIADRSLVQVGNELHLYLYLDQVDQELQKQVGAESFALGCTPMVNLFGQRAEPIPIDHRDTEYRVVPDARRPRSTEVYSLDRLSLTDRTRGEVECIPFFSLKHRDRDGAIFWHGARRRGGNENPGSEVFVSLVDLGFRISDEVDGVLDVETTCLNRDLPNRLPFGGGQPRLYLSEGGAPLARLECLTAPTRTLRPKLGDGATWRLVSHLLLNHVSITGGHEGVEALRELLRLYDFADSPATRSQIDGITAVRSRRVVRRITMAGRSAPCSGLEVELELDGESYRKTGLFVFASVFARFLPLYCSINSFVQLSARIKGREEVLKRWAPQTGSRAIL